MKRYVVLMVATAVLVFGLLKTLGQSDDGIPASVRADARKTFNNGKTCHIWRGTNTTVEVLETDGRNCIIVGPFYVIASPQASGPVPYDPAWQLVIMDKTNGIPDIQRGCVKSVGPETNQASASKNSSFSLFITHKANNDLKTKAKLSGKGSISVYVVQPTENVGQQISNELRLLVDIDNKKIVE